MCGFSWRPAHRRQGNMRGRNSVAFRIVALTGFGNSMLRMGGHCHRTCEILLLMQRSVQSSMPSSGSFSTPMQSTSRTCLKFSCEESWMRWRMKSNHKARVETELCRKAKKRSASSVKALWKLEQQSTRRSLRKSRRSLISTKARMLCLERGMDPPRS